MDDAPYLSGAEVTDEALQHDQPEQSDNAWRAMGYQPHEPLILIIRSYLALNRISLAVRVEHYISLVRELADLYSSHFILGRGLLDENSNRVMKPAQLLQKVRDPNKLLSKITNPGGSTYRVEERIFFVVARAFCGSTSGAGTLGAIATLKKRKKVGKHLQGYKWE